MMRKSTMKALKACLFVALIAFAGFQAQAQFSGSYAFPQNVPYTYGRMPNNYNNQDALDSYNYWKTNFITSTGACGKRRVIWDYFAGGRGKTDRSSTVSEGVAYGMLLAAYAGDRPLFDDLWDYYNMFKNGNGVMHWNIENCNVVGQNGASDAELDVAMALYVASFQWQDDSYLNDCKDMVRIIREKEFDGDILKPGDQFGGWNLTNPSYFSPAYYKVFAQYVEPGQATFWNNAVTKGYEIIDAADQGNNGLVPDWCRADGSFATGGEVSQYEDNGQNFIYDGIRAPMRSAIDYLWWGDADAADYCSRLTDWAFDNNNGGTESLGSKYSVTGQKLSNDHSNTFVGCFTVAGMASDVAVGNKNESQYQSYVDRGYTDNENTDPGYGQYFNATFKVLTQFIMSGNFYLPPPDNCTEPNLMGDKSLCAGNQTLDANVGPGGYSYVWKKNGIEINGATSKTYMVTSNGQYEVIATDGSGCTRRDKINVFEDALDADFTATTGPGNVTLTNTTVGGSSSFTWTIDGGSYTNQQFSTDEDAFLDQIPEGQYDITLDVENSGFGCSDVGSVTKTIVIGGGVGVAMDDFNDLFGDGIVVWDLAASADFDAIPKNYCSRDDFDAGLGNTDCFDLRCSYLDIVCHGQGASSQWTPFGMTFEGAAGPMDLTNIPYVSLKVSATADCELGVKLQNGDVAGDPIFIDVVAGETVFNLDFSTITTGWDNVASGPATITAWNDVNAMQFVPFQKDNAYTGTISIDWIVVGGQSLPKPEFDLKVDELGFLVYEDPDGDEVYTTVSSWEREVVACTGSADITANACMAEEIRWYSGNQLLGTGDQMTLSEGFYYVDLINQGGVTRDSVEVIASNLVADFTITQDNYDVHFFNSSTGFDTWAWDYGDVANNEPGSTVWDPGYHSYATAGEGTYTVGITVEDLVCGTSDTKTIDIDIVCELPADVGVITGDDVLCVKTETYSIDAPDNADSYFWDIPAGAVISSFNGDSVENSTEVVIDFTASTGGIITVSDFNECGSGADATLSVQVLDAPVAAFLASSDDLDATFTNTTVQSVDNTDWTVDAVAAGVLAVQSYTFPAAADYTLCLDVSNACGSDQHCETITITNCIPGAPSITIAESPAGPYCTGASVTFSITDSDNLGTTPTYSWKKNGANAGGTSTSFVTTSLIDGDVVTLNVTSSLSCATTTTATSNSITIDVTEEPVAGFTMTPNDLMYDFTNASTGDNLTYEWDFNNDNTVNSTDTDPSYEFATSGNYTACLTATNACASDEACETIVVIGVEDMVNGIGVSAYPTNVADDLYFDFGSESREFNVEIGDALGNTVYSGTVSSDKNVLEISDLNSGWYVIQLRNGSQVYSTRIVKN